MVVLLKNFLLLGFPVPTLGEDVVRRRLACAGLVMRLWEERVGEVVDWDVDCRVRVRRGELRPARVVKECLRVCEGL